MLLALLLAVPGSLSAQDKKKDDAKKKDESKVAKVEVTPAEAAGAIGDKIRFSAVGKDAKGQPLPDKVKLWFAAPFDIAGADEDGTISLIGPGEVVVGAEIGNKVGYARIKVSKPHVARIDVAAPPAAIVAGGAVQLQAMPRDPNGDPRSDIALAWSSDNTAIATVDGAGVVRGVSPGRATIRASGDGKTGETSVTVLGSRIAQLAVTPASARGRTGDVIHFAVTAKDDTGAAVNAVAQWSAGGAEIWPDGAFVAERPGTYTVEATIGDRTATASVVIVPRNVGRELEVVGRAILPDTQFAEEWIWGRYAYYSTISDKLLVYDISDPANPKQVDTLKVDARHINDVSVTADGKIGVITREGASNRKNGIVFLDTSDPAHPKILSDYTETVTGGVHSAFINSHYVYLTDDATGSMRVIDFADPKAPREVARWQVESPLAVQHQTAMGVQTAGRYLHDDQVLDGLAYL
ncbi:MAG: Ig-like domain-containing protein, partial [Burkholderiales bacterium]